MSPREFVVPVPVPRRGRRERMLELLAQIDARETEPSAMRERFGCSVTDARAAVRAVDSCC